MKYTKISSVELLVEQFRHFQQTNQYIKNLITVPRIILSKNEIVNHDCLCYEDNKFVACPEDKTFKDLKKEDKKELKEKGFLLESSVYELKSGGYLVLEYEKYIKKSVLEHPVDELKITDI